VSNLSPQALNGTTVSIKLLVADPDQLSERAIAVGHGHGAPSIAGRLIARRGLRAVGFVLLTLGLPVAGDRPPLSPRALGIYRIEAAHLQVRNGVERLGLSEATHVDFDEPSFLQQQDERLGVVG
jgi:hypothetical protein